MQHLGYLPTTTNDRSRHREPLVQLLWGPNRRHLVLGSTGLGELEGDAAAGQLAVDLRVGVEAVVDAAALLLVQDDLEGLGAVLLGAEALADDFDGVDEVGEDGVVDGRQSAAAGALLLLGVAGAGGALGAGQDAARGEDQDVAVRELLLELAGEAGAKMSARGVVTTFGRREGDTKKKGESYRCWTRWKPCRDGTGTKMTIAFLPWPTSIYCRSQKSACELPDSVLSAPGSTGERTESVDRFPSYSTLYRVFRCGRVTCRVREERDSVGCNSP